MNVKNVIRFKAAVGCKAVLRSVIRDTLVYEFVAIWRRACKYRAFSNEITCGSESCRKQSHMVRRNVEGAKNEMRKPSRGPGVRTPSSHLIRLLGSILSSPSGIRSGIMAENDCSIAYIMAVSERLIKPVCTVSGCV